MTDQSKRQTKSKHAGPSRGPRSWVFSMLSSALFIGGPMALSGIINPLLGRSTHWEYMAAGGPALFVALAVAFRCRWL